MAICSHQCPIPPDLKKLTRISYLKLSFEYIGFPGASAGKESTCNGFYPWVGKIPWRREWLPTLVFWPGEFHGLYSPWGCKESDTTE